MIFTRRQLAFFFAALTLAGWLLFPNEFFRGQMHRQRGDRSQAIAFFASYLAKHPFDKAATWSLAQAYEAAGRPEESLDRLVTFYRHRRGDRETGLAVLEFMRRCGADRRALEFEWELVGDLQARKSSRGLAQELLYGVYQRARADQDEASTDRALDALAQVSKEGESYRGEMLRRLLARGNFRSALAALREKSARDPKDLETRRQIIRVERFTGDGAGALRDLDAALALSPMSADLLAERASLFQSRRQWTKAVADLRLLEKLKPEEPLFPKELAYALIQSGRFDEGLARYEGFLKKTPGDRELWWSVIYAYSDRKDHARAADWLERYSARFPGDDKALEMLLYETEQGGRFDRAIAALKARFERDPSDVSRGRLLASMLIEQNRDDEALALYDRLMPVRPDDRDLWMAAVDLRERRHDFAGAALVLEKFVARFPGDGAAVDKLVYAYLATNRRPRAIDLLSAYLARVRGPRRTAGAP